MSKINAEKIKKIAYTVANVLVWIFLAFSLVITILVFSAQTNKERIPSLLGYSLLTVESDSMKGTFERGDLILMKRIEIEEMYELKAGEVITYVAPIDINNDGKVGDINTHRIVSNNPDTLTIVTQGDNKETNPFPDNEGDKPYTVSYTDVLGLWTGKPMRGVGNVISFLRSSLGFFLCVVLPLIAFFGYELYNFIALLLKEKKKAAPAGITKETEEEIKRRAIEEYIKQQAAASAEATASAEAEVAEATAPAEAEAAETTNEAEAEAKDE